MSRVHRDAPKVTHRHGGGHMEHPRLYDLLGHLFFAGRRRRVFGQLVALSGVRPGDRVLDLGCGTGYFTRRLAKRAGPGGSALGIDPSPDSLVRARRANRPANCTFAEGRAEALGLPDGSFDVVVTSLMVHHLPEGARSQTVGEMFRVLRPGGRVLVADFLPPANPLLRRIIHPVVSPAMVDNPVHLLEPMVREAGFERVNVGDVPPWMRYVTGAKPA